ncbi:MAG TPA: lipoprotein [Paenalcaligenes sp.]|nr:lipoprotein [Paenalcaligenes sp.]
MNSRHSSRRRHSGRSARLRPVAILAAAALLALSGCGYKGPLTLPPNDFAQSTQHHT